MNSKLHDDPHRLSVVVTPLQPPFGDDVVYFTFGDGSHLAVSKSDAEAMKIVMGQRRIKRTIKLEQFEGDKEKLRITAMQSNTAAS